MRSAAAVQQGEERPAALRVAFEEGNGLHVARDGRGGVVAVGAGLVELGEQLAVVAPAAPIELGTLIWDPARGYVIQGPGGAVVAVAGCFFDLAPQVAKLRPKPGALQLNKKTIFVKRKHLQGARLARHEGESLNEFVALAIRNETARRQGDGGRS